MIMILINSLYSILQKYFQKIIIINFIFLLKNLFFLLMEDFKFLYVQLFLIVLIYFNLNVLALGLLKKLNFEKEQEVILYSIF